jgi:solute:Na+ symporter, SSS family
MPASVTSIALLAANCGALEIIGITSASAKYGLAALHFYWIGAVPAMVFLALFMMPIYTKSQALTVPDFLRVRYNDATHLFSSCCLAARMALVAGISLYAISAVLHVFLGWTFSRVSVLACSVVLCYTALGGLRATIYTEILQLVLTIAGVLPLTYKILHDFDGIAGIRNRLPHEMAHIWTTLTWMNPTGAKLDRTGVIVGLGAVLSFGYWCTDFLIIQRALTARNLQNAIKTPLIAAVFKMCFPILLVVPGAAAAILIVKPSGTMQFDQALPAMMNHYYGAGLLALGLCAILASLMSGLAGNISALSVVWTQDLYRAHIQRTATD